MIEDNHYDEVKKLDQIAVVIPEGADIQKLLFTNQQEHINKAIMKFEKQKTKFEQNKYKRWVVTFCGLLVSIPLSIIVINIIQLGSSAFYTRTGLDSKLEFYYKNQTFNDVYSDELMAIAYDFNKKQPRFFSKYFIKNDPGQYGNFLIRDAVGASSSAPVYFNPLQHTDNFNETSNLVDGGVISNNPALYASLLAQMRGNNQLRVVSLGTGKSKKEMVD